MSDRDKELLNCDACDRPCAFETSVPSVLWNRVVRAQGLDEYLCAACIVRIFAKAGVSFTAELHGDGFNGLPIAVEINGAASTAPIELSEENNRLRVALAALRAERDSQNASYETLRQMYNIAESRLAALEEALTALEQQWRASAAFPRAKPIAYAVSSTYEACANDLAALRASLTPPTTKERPNE